MSTKKSILFVMQHPPYGSNVTQETLDAALAAATFEQTVQLLFSGDGVWSLMPSQQADPVQGKNIEKLLQALHYYDIDTIYADGCSLQERGISPENLALPATVLSADAQAALFRRVDCIITL